MAITMPRIYLAIALLGSVLTTLPLQASQQDRENARAGLSAFSREMSRCAAYFLLFAFIVENSAAPDADAELARRSRSTGQAVFVQAIKVSNYIGMDDHVATESLRVALRE